MSSDSDMLQAFHLHPVAIIVCGVHTPVGKAFLRRAKGERESFICIDVRQWLQNPAHDEGPKPWKVSHAENADSLICQLSLLHQEAFGTCVNALVGEITTRVEERKVFVLYCTAGQHRSDGVAKCLASRIFNCGPDECRLYNCAVFSLSGATMEHYDQQIVAQATTWVADPWLVRRCAEGELWGRQAGECSWTAHQTLCFIDHVGIHMRAAMTAVPEEEAKEEPASTAAGAYGASTADADVASEASPDTAPPVEPVAARRRPKRRLRSPVPKRLSHHPFGRGKARGTTRRRPAETRSSASRDAIVDAHRKEKCLLCQGTGEARDLPNADDLNAWSVVLSNMGVDDRARHDWISLYASTATGKTEALSIVHKLLKKDSGGYAVQKPSAFVVSAVGSAWRDVRDLPPRKRHRESATEWGEGGNE